MAIVRVPENLPGLRSTAGREGIFTRRVAWGGAALIAVLSNPASAQYTAPQGAGGRSSGQSLPPLTYSAPEQPGAEGAPRRAWEIVPTLYVEETYTDNVRLSPPGSERSDWVTEVRPGVAIYGNGARVRLRADYSPRLVYRVNEGDDIYHYLNATGNAELLPGLFFVDANAQATQQNVSLLGPQAQSNVNVTGNRTNVRSYRLSPYLREQFGSDAVGELRYTYSSVDSSAITSFADSDSNRIDLRVTSGPAFRLLTWNVAYSKENIDYRNTRDVDLETISAGLGRLITPTLRLLGNVGYEDNNYITTGPEPKGSFWSVGPEWTPTPRTRIAATTGRRYFGSTQSFDLEHRTRLTTWNVRYSEGITTAQQEVFVPVTVDAASFLDTLFLSRIPDPVARQQAVQAFIAQTGIPSDLTVPLNFLTTTPYLLKQWNAAFGIQGVRNTVLANAFASTREAVAAGQPGAGDFAASSNTKQTGTSLTWSLRVTPQTTSNVSAGYTRTEFPGLARDDDLTFIRLQLTHRFQPNLSGSLSFRRLDNDSNQPGGGYTENAVAAALSMQF